jgi:integrase
MNTFAQSGYGILDDFVLYLEVKLLKEPKGKLRYLDHEEEAKLLAHAREPLRTITMAGIYAGLRIQAEALTLKWEDIDFRRGLLTVRAAYAKSREGRAVNIHSILKAALNELKDGRGPSTSLPSVPWLALQEHTTAV